MNLIFLHGALGDSETLEPLAGLMSKDHRVFRFDFDGHGKSAPQRELSMNKFAGEVRDFITDRGLVRPIIFGYSMGGYAALQMAAQNPGLASGIFTLATKFDWNPDQAQREAKMLNPKAIAEKVPAFAKVLRLRHGDKWETLCQATSRMMLALGEAQPPDFSKIDCRVLISVGALDKMVTIEESVAVARCIPDAEFHLFEDMQHPIEKVNPATVADRLQTFIGT